MIQAKEGLEIAHGKSLLKTVINPMSENPYLAHLKKKPKKTESISLSKKPGFPYGNYHNYYGYRNVGDMRISFIKQEWIKGKEILDIGCNQGHISLNLARMNPKAIVGVDIDPVLIAKARYQKVLARSKALERDAILWDYFPASIIDQFGPLCLVHDQNSPDLLQNVHFRCSDWVHEPVVPNSFDVILALSISKWIHLNSGDGGLRHFFNKSYQTLRSGGLFIFEPQPWDGYAKRAGLSKEMRDNYNEIEFFPDDFLRYITKKVGFKHLSSHNPPHTSKGFERSLYILQKI